MVLHADRLRRAILSKTMNIDRHEIGEIMYKERPQKLIDWITVALWVAILAPMILFTSDSMADRISEIVVVILFGILMVLQLIPYHMIESKREYRTALYASIISSVTLCTLFAGFLCAHALVSMNIAQTLVIIIGLVLIFIQWEKGTEHLIIAKVRRCAMQPPKDTNDKTER